MQAEEAALLAVDMAAAERRIQSALQTHVSQLREQLESEQRAGLLADLKLQVLHVFTLGALTHCCIHLNHLEILALLSTASLFSSYCQVVNSLSTAYMAECHLRALFGL